MLKRDDKWLVSGGMMYTEHFAEAGIFTEEQVDIFQDIHGMKVFPIRLLRATALHEAMIATNRVHRLNLLVGLIEADFKSGRKPDG